MKGPDVAVCLFWPIRRVMVRLRRLRAILVNFLFTGTIRKDTDSNPVSTSHESSTLSLNLPQRHSDLISSTSLERCCAKKASPSSSPTSLTLLSKIFVTMTRSPLVTFIYFVRHRRHHLRLARVSWKNSGDRR